MPGFSWLFCCFGSIHSQGTHNAEEYFGIIHDAVEVFRARAFSIQRYIIGCMAFIPDSIRNIRRNEFNRISFVMAGRISLGNDCGYLMIFRLIPYLLRFLPGYGFRNGWFCRFLLEVEVFIICRVVSVLVEKDWKFCAFS